MPYIRSLGDCRVLDLCAGSGCIGLAVASQCPGVHVVLGEFSDAALKICRQNIRRNGLTGRVIPMTGGRPGTAGPGVGRISLHRLSNPPYIPRR